VKYQAETDREIIHTQNKKDTIHAMKYKAKQSKQSKGQKRAKGIDLEEPQCQRLTIT